MKKYNLLLSIISLSLFIPTLTYADCTKEELDNFKEIENEYKVTYEFDRDSKKYKLKFINPNYENYGYMLFYEISEEQTKYYDLRQLNTEEYEQSDFEAGKYRIEIYGKTETCNEKLKEITLKLSKYNQFSEDPLCSGIEDFVLCQPTYDKDIDYNTFVSRINSYKKKIESSNTNNTDNQKKEEDSKIVKYIKDNLIQIIIVIIFIIMVTVTAILTANSIKKSRRLE